jgi:hypothetical protein
MEEPLIIENKEIVDKYELKKKKAIEKYGYKNDPYVNANFLSKIFYYWAFRIIILANITPIKAEYLGRTEGPNASKNYSQKMFKIWHEWGYKAKKTHALLFTIMRSNLTRVLLMLLFSLINVSCDFSTVWLFREYMKSFKPNYKPYFEKNVLGILFI